MTNSADVDPTERFERITLVHGNGGRRMRALIADIFARHLANPWLDTNTDAAILPRPEGDMVYTTDGFTVEPLEFPGGDIGSLAVHGTLNDLAVCGATPLYLALNAIIEEGLEWQRLDRIVRSLARAARADGVHVVTGDTKVVPRGQAGGLYLGMSGIGVRPATLQLGLDRIRAGDCLLVSGPVGDHGTAVLLAREAYGMRGSLQSDSASILPLTRALLSLPGLRFLRDPTRGGLATVAHEIAQATAMDIQLEENTIPLRAPVRAVCEMLGFDPLYLACEGRVVAVVDPAHAAAALATWHQQPAGTDAAIIGRVTGPGPGRVWLTTTLGGLRALEELEDDPLPRIC
jgi:hydrogenase expression/formation protein HypE